MTQTQQTPIVGKTLLPGGTTLSEYFLQVREKAFLALSTYAIASDELIDMYVVCKAMNIVGWKTEIDYWAGILEYKDMECRRFERTYLLMLDDGTAISDEGVIGLDDIRDRVEQNLRRPLIASVERAVKNGSNELLNEGLLKSSMQWRRSMDDAHIAFRSNRIKRFNEHPSSHKCIDSVVSVLSAHRLADLTLQVSLSSPSHSRL